MEKLWMDCTKEERQKVNTVKRCYRAFKYGYETGQYTKRQWLVLKQKCLDTLDFLEWYYSDEITDKRDFINWRDSWLSYQDWRDKNGSIIGD